MADTKPPRVVDRLRPLMRLAGAVLHDVGDAVESIATTGDWQSLCEANAALENDLGNARVAIRAERGLADLYSEQRDKAQRAADTFREMLRDAERERDEARAKLAESEALAERAVVAGESIKSRLDASDALVAKLRKREPAAGG